MRKSVVLVALVATALAVSACSSRAKRSSSGKTDDSGSSSSTYTPAPGSAGRTTPRSSINTAATSEASGASGLADRVIYFDLDSADIKPEGLAIVDAWAQYMARTPSAKIRVEGHCDERGTREYNVGLGERRANAVAQALTARGAGQAQVSVVSFGEERPVALGHDDSAWAQNRRVELVD